MHRLSISEFSSYRWPLFQELIRYSSVGINRIGLWRSKVEEFGFEAAADLLYEMRISPSSLSWAGGFTGGDGTPYTLAIDDAIQAVYQAHMVGADKLIVFPGSRNGHTDRHAMRLVTNAIETILPQAIDLGVKLVIKPVLRRNNAFSFIQRPDDYLQLVKPFDREHVAFSLDLFHVGRSLEMMAKFDQFSDRIALVQLADARMSRGSWIRCALGKGVVPLRQWLKLLNYSNYSGDLEIQLLGPAFRNQNYSDTIRQAAEYYANELVPARTGVVR